MAACASQKWKALTHTHARCCCRSRVAAPSRFVSLRRRPCRPLDATLFCIFAAPPRLLTADLPKFQLAERVQGDQQYDPCVHSREISWVQILS